MENTLDERYASGEYLEMSPAFHVERADFKIEFAAAILKKHSVMPGRICDHGCGAGEVLHLLSSLIRAASDLRGYELSPQGSELCQIRVDFRLKSLNQRLFETAERYDPGIAVNAFEHVGDSFSVLRLFKPDASNFDFRTPLDTNAKMVLRGTPIRKARWYPANSHDVASRRFWGSTDRWIFLDGAC